MYPSVIKLTCTVCPLGKKKKKGRVIDGHELVMESIFGNTYIIPPPRNSFVALFSVGEFANKG